LDDFSIPKTKHFLSLNNNACHLIEANTKKGLDKQTLSDLFLYILEGRNENLCQQSDLTPLIFDSPDHYV